MSDVLNIILVINCKEVFPNRFNNFYIWSSPTKESLNFLKLLVFINEFPNKPFFVFALILAVAIFTILLSVSEARYSSRFLGISAVITVVAGKSP